MLMRTWLARYREPWWERLVWGGMTAGFYSCFCYDFILTAEAAALLKDKILSIAVRETISYLKFNMPEVKNYITPQRHIRIYGNPIESSKNCPIALLFSQTAGGSICAHLLNDQGKIRSRGCYIFERLLNCVYNLCSSPQRQMCTSNVFSHLFSSRFLHCTMLIVLLFKP